jgi:hypothetical protein
MAWRKGNERREKVWMLQRQYHVKISRRYAGLEKQDNNLDMT